VFSACAEQVGYTCISEMLTYISRSQPIYNMFGTVRRLTTPH